MAVMATIVLAACDDHQDFPDTAMKVTHILTTDGNVMPYDTYEQSGKQAIAVVFHINGWSSERRVPSSLGLSRDATDEGNANQREDMDGNGYAVYLWDIAPESFADSIGVEQGTSADLTAYDGNANTFALYETTDVKSPLAERVFDLWRYGQSAYIPSVAQMRLLYHAKDIINPYILKCGGTPIPDEDDDCWYWTSTEVKGQATAKSWLYSLGSGAIQETPKWQAHKARPIITIND